MFDHYAQLKDSALRHLDKAAAFARTIKRETIAKQIELGRQSLADSRYNIAIVGDMNRGKSTLLNTLLGRRDDHLSPIQAKVCTSSIVHYLSREAHPEQLSEARVFFDNSNDPETIPVECLRGYITEEGNPENIKQVRSVDVYGDFPLLRNVVTLVDTPGRGAINRNHEILVEQFMPLADAIIVLISADLPVTASEQEFLNQLGKEDRERIFFVLTKRDEVADKDINEVRNYVDNQIRKANLSCDRLFEVSARELYEAVRDGADQSTIERIRKESGVGELEFELEKFILNTSSKNSAMMPRLRKMLDFLGNFYVEEKEVAEKDLDRISKGSEGIEDEISKLKKSSIDLKMACEGNRKKFENAWNRSVSNFCRRAENRSAAVSDRILDRVARGGVISAFKVPQLVKESLSKEIQVILPDLDQKLSEHVENLSEDLDKDWETYVRTKAPSDLTLPAAALVGLGGSSAAAINGFVQISAALNALSATGQAAVVANGTFGIIPSVMGWFGFGGKIAAATAATAATGTLVASLAPVALAAGVYIGTRFILKGVNNAVQQNRVPALVDEAILEMTKSIEHALKERCSELVEAYRQLIDERIEQTEKRLQELQRSMLNDDPGLRDRLSHNAEVSRLLIVESRDLNHSFNLISISPDQHV